MILRTHSKSHTPTPFEFYILTKGNNSGKPLDAPCANCLVCITHSLHEKTTLYWMCYGFWQGRIFEQYLKGSVIPFIRINDVFDTLVTAKYALNQDPERIASYVRAIQNIDALEKNIALQRVKLNDLKRSLANKLISTITPEQMEAL